MYNGKEGKCHSWRFVSKCASSPLSSPLPPITTPTPPSFNLRSDGEISTLRARETSGFLFVVLSGKRETRIAVDSAAVQRTRDTLSTIKDDLKIIHTHTHTRYTEERNQLSQTGK